MLFMSTSWNQFKNLQLNLCSIPLSTTSKIQLYADDILLHKPIGRDCTLDVANVQRDIDSVAAWANLSGLHLNTQKLNFYWFLDCLLNWPELCTRRKRQKLLLCNRIFNGYSFTILPPSLFTPHPFPHLRHNHSLPLYHPTCRSTDHLSPFSVSVVPIMEPSTNGHCLRP